MTLHLTRDEADRLTADGRVVLFRAGVDVLLKYDDGTSEALSGAQMPAEFVEAVKPCETCGGDGVLLDGLSWQPEPPCPDCIDGKRCIAAVVPCDTCVPHHPGSTVIDDCPDCGLRSFVTVATVVVEWGPWLATGANAEWVHVPPHGRRPITLPPDVDPGTIVGQYALAIRVVNERNPS